MVNDNQDPTEDFRRDAVAQINHAPSTRLVLQEKYGQVWDTQELTQDFEVTGFMAPFVAVTRKSDSKKGTLTFQHSPRFYFDFSPES